MHEWTQACLVTSEFLNITLSEIYALREKIELDGGKGAAGDAPLIDFSPVILSIFKAVEIEIAEAIFRPFRKELMSSDKRKLLQLPVVISAEEKTIFRFIQNKREELPRLALEDLSQIFAQLTSVESRQESVLFCLKQWMNNTFLRPQLWWSKNTVFKCILSEISERNKAAHTWRFSPLEALKTYERLWGTTTSEGMLSVFFEAIERGPRQGEQLDKYKINARILIKPRYWLIQGTDNHMNHKCMLSFSLGDFKKTKKLTESFDLINAVKHKNLLPLKEWFPAPAPYSGYSIVVSHCDAYSQIKKKVVSQNLSEIECKHLLLSIAMATACLHNNNLVHGFISPHMIFRDRDGCWLLGGQVFLLLARAQHLIYLYPRVIAPEISDGAGYVAPSRLTPMSDVFAIAATVCCLRRGAKERNCGPPKSDEINVMFRDLKLQEVLRKALSLNPNERYKNANELSLEFGSELSDNVTDSSIPKIKPRSIEENTWDTGRSRRVFISYSHKDHDIVAALTSKLLADGVDVITDTGSMKIGDNINNFILKSVRNSDVTLSIVSKNSLLSAWVAMETINTFNSEIIGNTKKFIPCNIDEDFFCRNFTDDALNVIEDQINEIDEIIKKRLVSKRGIRDLENERNRYRDLAHNLDEIVRRIRESLCADISEGKFDANFPKIISAVNP